MDRSWIVVVPVKRLDTAKSRLAPHLGELRRDLALAMALDTIGVAASCCVRTVVVTDDEEVTDALGALDVEVVTDEPRDGINAALVHGAQRAQKIGLDVAVAALAADLPALRRDELSTALSLACAHEQSFVRDAAGTGTTLYAAATITSFRPQFGPGSAAAHAAAGVALDTDRLSSLRRDVDTIDDLRAAGLLGLHARTAAVVARLHDRDLRAARAAS